MPSSLTDRVHKALLYYIYGDRHGFLPDEPDVKTKTHEAMPFLEALVSPHYDTDEKLLAGLKSKSAKLENTELKTSLSKIIRRFEGDERNLTQSIRPPIQKPANPNKQKGIKHTTRFLYRTSKPEVSRGLWVKELGLSSGSVSCKKIDYLDGNPTKHLRPWMLKNGHADTSNKVVTSEEVVFGNLYRALTDKHAAKLRICQDEENRFIASKWIIPFELGGKSIHARNYLANAVALGHMFIPDLHDENFGTSQTKDGKRFYVIDFGGAMQGIQPKVVKMLETALSPGASQEQFQGSLLDLISTRGIKYFKQFQPNSEVKTYLNDLSKHDFTEIEQIAASLDSSSTISHTLDELRALQAKIKKSPHVNANDPHGLHATQKTETPGYKRLPKSNARKLCDTNHPITRSKAHRA